MNICIIGTGYVGLSTGLCLSEVGHNVICCDCNQEKIENLKKGIVPIYEPQMDKLIHKNTALGRLDFTTNTANAIKKSEVCFIAVGTPCKENGEADTSQVENAIKTIAQNIEKYTVIVNKSTLPIGFAQKTRQIMKEITNVDFDVVSNPEFLRQGCAIEDCINPQRVVIGSNSKRAIEKMIDLYEPFNIEKDRYIITNDTSSELIKYAANSFLALKISYINEISLLCEKIGADIEEVKKGLKTDSRIGDKFLEAGLGYGGSCFPKDVSALIEIAKQNDVDLKIINQIKKVNDNQKEHFLNKILNYYNNDIKGKTFALWGLTFKPNTNDLREAPSITIIKKFLELGATIKAYDPKGFEQTKIIFKDKITYAKDKYDALKDANALILVTEWDEFKNPDFDFIEKNIKDKIIFDGRNQYNFETLRKHNLKYICIGRNE